MLKIRLQKKSNKLSNSFRIVVIKKNYKRDGVYTESIGIYNPAKKYLILNISRFKYWISIGTELSATVIKLTKTFSIL